MTTSHDVCLVGLKCYDLLVNNDVPKYLGGIERVLVSLARGLAAAGISVAFITFDEGYEDGITIDGITLYKAYDIESGIRGIRLVYPRMTGIWGAMRRANASVYLQMGAGIETLVSAVGTRFLFDSKRKSVFCVGSDSDCLRKLPLTSSNKEKLFYRLGLSLTDAIVSQTMKQRHEMLESFGKSSTVIAMPYEPVIQRASFDARKRTEETVHIIWVGRIVETKRLEMLVNLAKHYRTLQFDIVGSANSVSDYAKSVLAKAAAQDNVVVHGRISDRKLSEMYDKAFILCCTSSLEGFPTTFLEAWSHGLPVLTTFDPDDVVSNNNVGFAVSNEDELLERTGALLADKLLYQTLSDNAQSYYQENYTAKAIVPYYLQLFSLPA